MNNKDSGVFFPQRQFNASLALFDPQLAEVRQSQIEHENKARALTNERKRFESELAGCGKLKDQIHSYREKIAYLGGEVNLARGIAEAQDAKTRQLGNTVRQQSRRTESLETEINNGTESIS